MNITKSLMPGIYMALFLGLLNINFIQAAEQEPDTPEAQAMQVLDDFMLAFNTYDAKAWMQTLHFPHYRLANGEMVILQSGDETLERLKYSISALRQSGWHHSAWTLREIVHTGPNKVHINTRFTRYREDGSIIASYDSLYIVTFEQGRWAVKMRSSFA